MLIWKGRLNLLESIGVFSPVYPSGHAAPFTAHPPAWLPLEAAVRGHHHMLLSEKAPLHICDTLWVETAAATPTRLAMSIDTQEDLDLSMNARLWGLLMIWCRIFVVKEWQGRMRFEARQRCTIGRVDKRWRFPLRTMNAFVIKNLSCPHCLRGLRKVKLFLLLNDSSKCTALLVVSPPCARSPHKVSRWHY